MNRDIIKFFRTAAPFLITVVLWRLALPWVNPAGILAIILLFV